MTHSEYSSPFSAIQAHKLGLGRAIAMTNTLPPPELQHVCDISVELVEVKGMGSGRAGQQRIMQIVGYTVEGAFLTGRHIECGFNDVVCD